MAQTLLDLQLALEDIIRKRQFFESFPYPPFPIKETDINYFDIHGNTVLHYAAARGDLEKVKACLAQGADINLLSHNKESAIQLALAEGQLEVAQYLYQQGATCFKVPLHVCKDEKCRAWYEGQIKQALQMSYPSNWPIHYQTTKPNQIFPGSHKSKESFSSLSRAVEVGDIGFMQSVISESDPTIFKWSLEGNPNEESLLITAVKNGQRKMVEWLLANGADINNKKMFSNSALKEAILKGDENMIEYLLSRGADIDKQDTSKRTPLMAAIVKNNLELIKKLLEKKVIINNKTVSGNNIFHVAAEFATPEVMQKLASEPGAKLLMRQKNIYGQSPYEIALQHNNTAVLKFLPEIKSEKAKRNIDINQRRVIAKMFYYLVSRYRSTEYFSLNGHCNGLAFLRAFYAARGMTDYYSKTMALMAEWDGTERSLRAPFNKDIDQAKYYNNLGEVFEQWINDVIWYQHDTLQCVDALDQKNRSEQNTLIQGKNDKHKYDGKDYVYCPLYVEEYNHLSDDGKLTSVARTPQQLREFFYYFLRMPREIHVEIGGGQHAISVAKTPLNELDCYDPNFTFDVDVMSDIDSLVECIIDYKYILINKEFNFVWNLFHFNKDANSLDLQNFKIFTGNELPKNKEQAKAFQDQSANKFTHLHVAVMTHSLPVIKQLLAEGNCDVNALDVIGRSALRLAIDTNYHEAVDLILQSPQFDPSGLTRFAVTLYAQDNKKVLQTILASPHAKNMSALLLAAIDKKDVALVEQLIVNKKVDINEVCNYRLPIVQAIENDDLAMVSLLLKHHADVQKFETRSFFPRNAILAAIHRSSPEVYSAVIPHCPNIHVPDGSGKTPAQTALRLQNIYALEDLLKKGADANELYENHFKSFTETSLEEEMFPKFKKIILSYMKFDLSKPRDEQKLLNLLLENITNADDVFRILLDKSHPALLNARAPNGHAIWHFAIFKQQFNKFKMLLEAKCDVNIVTPAGNTALMGLVRMQNFPEKYAYIETLLKYQPKIDIKNKDGKTAIDLVQESGDEKLKEIFVAHHLIPANRLGL